MVITYLLNLNKPTGYYALSSTGGSHRALDTMYCLGVNDTHIYAEIKPDLLKPVTMCVSVIRIIKRDDLQDKF